MVYHVAGWAQNVDGAGTEADMNAITDTAGFPRVSNTTDILVPQDFRYVSGFYAGVDATVAPKARLKSPSLDAIYGTDQGWLPFINDGAVPDSPHLFNDFRQTPWALQPNEALKYKTLNNPAAAVDQVGIAMLSDGKIQPVDPMGGFWVRGTLNSAATTSLQWALRTWTPDTTLPSGQYAFLGIKAIDAAGIAARLVFPNQTARPGAPMLATETDRPARSFEVPGQWGVLGVASTLNLPGVEILTSGAITRSQVVYLHVKKVSNNA